MSSIVPHNHDFAREQCIETAFRPFGAVTDWDAVIADAGTLDSGALTEDLRAGMPYDNNETNQLLVFRMQSKIRIALRHKQGLPQYAKHICASCGTRKSDPVLGSDWKVGLCIHCAEEATFYGHYKYSRHDETGLFVAFDITTGSWGIAYEHEPDRERKMGGIIVSGFANRKEAVLYQFAPVRFAQVFNRVCKSGCEVDVADVVSPSLLFQKSLPMNPEQWKAFLSENMRNATPESLEPYHWEIRHAVDGFYKREH